MTALADLVATSRQVAATRARSVKTRVLADYLRTLGAQELEIAVRYLAGEIRQGRIGIGPAALQACATDAAPTSTLALLDVDRVLDELAALSGSGSGAQRTA